MKITNGTLKPVTEFNRHKSELEKKTANLNTSNIHSVQIAMNDEESINDERKYIAFIVFFSEHRNKKNEIATSIASTPTIAAMNGINEIIKRRDCLHDWSPIKDDFNQDFCDGRGICLKCNEKGIKVLPINPGCVVSIYKGTDFVAQQNWPKGTMLQGGHKGIVLRKKGNYVTSFIENFPTIDGVSTFIRGEGPDLLSAELECYKKQSKMESCKNHEWSRNTSNGYRTSGYAECKKCELSGNVFKPETQCQKCDQETIRILGNRYMCLEHQYSMNIDDFIEIKKEEEKTSIFSSEKNGEKELASYYFQFPIIKAILEKYGELFYEKKSSFITSLLCELECKLADSLPGVETYSVETFEVAKSKEAETLIHLFTSELEKYLGKK